MRLELTDDQALVFFEWLSRLDEKDAFPVEDISETYVLWQLHGQLEKALDVQFLGNYKSLVASARGRLKEMYGEE